MKLFETEGTACLPLHHCRTFTSLARRSGDEESLESLFWWLERNDLVHQGDVYDAHLSPDGTRLLSYEATALGLPCRPEERRSRDELKRIKEQYGAALACPSDADREKIWKEIRHPGDTIRGLDLSRLPADAMAFYRFFHCHHSTSGASILSSLASWITSGE